MILEQDKDTIAAVSTAPGTGGISVVRLSGSRALQVIRPLAPFLPPTPESHRVYFGTLLEPNSREPIDEVLVSYFAHGKSFTGEEVLEISCHGGDWLSHKIVQSLFSEGARAATRGEFTYRAFMNGRIDLVQAEAVLSLIESKSQASARAAIRQLKGASSRRLHQILDIITGVAAQLEANIDYAQEDIVVEDHSSLDQRLDGARTGVRDLLATENQGRLWNEGFHVALLGLPNVGKSSLLNALLQEDRAIVTDVPGTTRDLVEGRMSFHGVEVRLTDTAGLRDSNDQVEKIGIARSRTTAESADMIFFLFDGQDLKDTVFELSRLTPAQRERTVLLRSKSDLSSPDLAKEIEALRVEATHREFIELAVWLESFSLEKAQLFSSRTSHGLPQLRERLQLSVQSQLVEDAPMSLRARHVELLKKVETALVRAGSLLRDEASPEFAAFEMKVAVVGLHEILGTRFDDQIMDRVFQDFCLGK